jgi:hypothetical protein
MPSSCRYLLCQCRLISQTVTQITTMQMTIVNCQLVWLTQLAVLQVDAIAVT